MLAGKVYKWGKENQRVSIIFLSILGDFGKFGIDTSIWSRYVFWAIYINRRPDCQIGCENTVIVRLGICAYLCCQFYEYL